MVIENSRIPASAAMSKSRLARPTLIPSPSPSPQRSNIRTPTPSKPTPTSKSSNTPSRLPHSSTPIRRVSNANKSRHSVMAHRSPMRPRQHELQQQQQQHQNEHQEQQHPQHQQLLLKQPKSTIPASPLVARRAAGPVSRRSSPAPQHQMMSSSNVNGTPTTTTTTTTAVAAAAATATPNRTRISSMASPPQPPPRQSLRRAPPQSQLHLQQQSHQQQQSSIPHSSTLRTPQKSTSNTANSVTPITSNTPTPSRLLRRQPPTVTTTSTPTAPATASPKSKTPATTASSGLARLSAAKRRTSGTTSHLQSQPQQQKYKLRPSDPHGRRVVSGAMARPSDPSGIPVRTGAGSKLSMLPRTPKQNQHAQALQKGRTPLVESPYTRGVRRTSQPLQQQQQQNRRLDMHPMASTSSMPDRPLDYSFPHQPHQTTTVLPCPSPSPPAPQPPSTNTLTANVTGTIPTINGSATEDVGRLSSSSVDRLSSTSTGSSRQRVSAIESFRAYRRSSLQRGNTNDEATAPTVATKPTNQESQPQQHQQQKDHEQERRLTEEELLTSGPPPISEFSLRLEEAAAHSHANHAATFTPPKHSLPSTKWTSAERMASDSAAVLATTTVTPKPTFHDEGYEESQIIDLNEDDEDDEDDPRMAAFLNQGQQSLPDREERENNGFLNNTNANNNSNNNNSKRRKNSRFSEMEEEVDLGNVTKLRCSLRGRRSIADSHETPRLRRSSVGISVTGNLQVENALDFIPATDFVQQHHHDENDDGRGRVTFRRGERYALGVDEST